MLGRAGSAARLLGSSASNKGHAGPRRMARRDGGSGTDDDVVVSPQAIAVGPRIKRTRLTCPPKMAGFGSSKPAGAALPGREGFRPIGNHFSGGGVRIERKTSQLPQSKRWLGGRPKGRGLDCRSSHDGMRGDCRCASNKPSQREGSRISVSVSAGLPSAEQAAVDVLVSGQPDRDGERTPRGEPGRQEGHPAETVARASRTGKGTIGAEGREARRGARRHPGSFFGPEEPRRRSWTIAHPKGRGGGSGWRFANLP